MNQDELVVMRKEDLVTMMVDIVRETSSHATEGTFNRLMKQYGKYFGNQRDMVSINAAHKITGLSREEIKKAIATGRVDGGWVDGSNRYEVSLKGLREAYDLH